MKFIYSFLFICCINSASLFAQVSASFGVLYTAPLNEFFRNNYQDGYGAKFGVGYTHFLNDKVGLEGGLNWLVSRNGSEMAELTLGDYTLSNNFYNWQIKLNAVYKTGIFKNYFGLHAGRANYYSTEYLSFNTTQEDGVTYYSESLFKERVFQFGFQLGTYIQLTPITSLDFGISFLKSFEGVQYIDFDSYTFDGEYLDYNENFIAPTLFVGTISLKFNLSRLIALNNNAINQTSANTGAISPYNYSTNRNNTHQRSTGSNTNNNQTKKGKSAKPKLHKVGKTPVNYK